MSRIGRQPITVPSGVDIKVDGSTGLVQIIREDPAEAAVRPATPIGV